MIRSTRPQLPDVSPPAPIYRASVAQLARVQKSNAGAPAYSRFVNRPLGRRFAAAAHVLGMTPNAVTALSAAFSAAGITLIATAQPRWWVGVLVALLLVIGYVLDAADGQLARLRGGGSLTGEWLDHVVDSAKISALHLAVLIGAYRFLDLDAGWLLVPIGFTVVANVTFFAMILNGLLRDRRAAATGVPLTRPASSSLRSLLVLPTDYGLLCMTFALLGAPALFFGVYAVLFALNAVFLSLALVKWYGAMAALGRSIGPQRAVTR